MAKTINDILKGGQKIIERGLKQELRDQGHFLTGELERSLDADVKAGALDGKGKAYLHDLESGIPGSRIVINSQTLAEMTRYVELRMGYKGRKALRVANLILRKQQKEGMPTKASARFSKSRVRKKAVTRGFKKAETELDNHILNGMEEYVSQFFNKQKSETV